MTRNHSPGGAGNPFSTRYVRPGALSFEFPPETSAARLVDKLADLNWRGQIIGPHGSGKSTLLAALVEELGRRGHAVRCYELHDGQRRLPSRPLREIAGSEPELCVIDGYEQLSWLSRARLKWSLARRRAGLLITAHLDLGLPVLMRTEVTSDLARRLVARLLEACNGEIKTADIDAAWQNSGGNLREMFFELYDAFESRRAGR